MKKLLTIPHLADKDGCCRAIRATIHKVSPTDFDPYTRGHAAWITGVIELWKKRDEDKDETDRH